jgi:hypothetical protein
MFVQDTANFVADKVFPVVPVAKQSDKYVTFPKGFFFRDEVKPRPLGGRAPVAGYEVGEGTYIAEEFALAHKIDDRVRANADQPLDPDRAAMRLLTTQMLIHRDIDWVTTFFGTSIWGLDRTGVASGPTGNEFIQFDAAGSDPIGLVEAEKERIVGVTGYSPNVLVMGAKVFRIVKSHSDVIDRVKYTQTGIVDLGLLASLFGVDKVVVPRSVQNTANEGAADAISFIVPSDDMLLCYSAPAPAIEVPSGGYIFAWTGLIPGATNAFGGVIQRGREDLAHSDHVEIRASWDQKLIASELGTFFNTAVS